MTKTRLDLFYEQSLADSSVTTAEDLKNMLKECENFDWEEFNKPVNQIDM